MKTIFYSFAALIRKILSSPLEDNKIYIYTILYISLPRKTLDSTFQHFSGKNILLPTSSSHMGIYKFENNTQSFFSNFIAVTQSIIGKLTKHNINFPVRQTLRVYYSHNSHSPAMGSNNKPLVVEGSISVVDRVHHWSYTSFVDHTDHSELRV